MLCKQPFVSIITPSYNQGRFIEDTIQSVLCQDYPNIEHIVIDGASQDQTLSILQRYDKHLRWRSEPDAGQADAVNKGFQLAQGEILGWLNSDDTYLPGAISHVVQYFQAHPEVSMVYGEGYHVDASGQVIERYGTEAFDPQRLSERCFICQPTVFLRAQVFRDVGPLDTSLHYCLDYEYWMRIAKRFQIGYTNAYLATSRLHMDTKTLSRRMDVHAESLQVVQRHYGHVPVLWLYAYAAASIATTFWPQLHGIYRDGWAAPWVRLFLWDRRRSYVALTLQGSTATYAHPLPLRILVGDHLQYETVITDAQFALRVPFDADVLQAASSQALEISIHADATFSPQAVGVNNDSRPASYHCRRLALLDANGQEHVIYSTWKALLAFVWIPCLLLWKAVEINHRLPGVDLWQQALRLWRQYKKRTL